MSEPPFVVSFEHGQGKGNSVHGTLTLSNETDEARWLVLSANLDERLAESFDAQLVQLCTFEHDPSVHYLQALGTETGLVAFHLGPDVSIALDRFAFRSYGDAPILQLWEAAEIRAADAPVEDSFPALTPIAAPTAIAEAYKRETTSTHKLKPCPVTLDVLKRWALKA